MSRRVRHLNPAQCGAQIALDARYISGVADGAALDTWSARANSSISATASGSNRPTFRASSINGRPAVEFDGSDDVMALGAGALSLTNNAPSCMITSVVRADGTGDTTQMAMFLAAGSGALRIELRSSSSLGAVASSRSRRLDADTLTSVSAAGTTTTECVISSLCDWSGNSLIASRNGLQGASSTFASGAGNSSATNSTVVNIGAQNSTTNRVDGVISCVVVAVPIPLQPLRNRIRQSLGFSYSIATA